ERRLEPLRGTLDSGAVYVVLAPPVELTGAEVGAVLRAVRAGAGLLYIVRAGSPLADSLGVRLSPWRGRLLETVPAPETGVSPAAATPMVRYTLHDSLPTFPDVTILLSARDSGAARPVVLGRALGRGRVVIVTEPRILGNAALRAADNGVLAARMLEYASPRSGARLVFPEYLFGYGRRTGMSDLMARALLHTAPGRATLVLGAAALLLLLAVSPRPIAPVERARVERRSPLEHVGALARAYEQIGATRSSVRRLVRGVRRRHGARGAAGHAQSEEELLAALRSRHPAAAQDVALLERALREPLTPPELRDAGEAVARLERTIFPTRA
ncbi:MAG TPA: DUF4350 domain-containing protein, partial [Gemmatimonadaceae bacterium]|nr:DUF4350 domain-containing protein [Gemmatimonadaceae bacterium]